MASDSVFRFLPISRRRLLASCAIPCLAFAASAYGAPQEPRAVAVVTDQTSVTLSDKFFAQSTIGLKANGDVFFGAPSAEVFYWNSSTGTRTRLLQVNDPIPGFPGSVAVSVASPLRLNTAGHAALLNTWAAPGVRNPNGIFIYDGSTYSKVVLSGEPVPGLTGSVFSTIKDLRVNANDQVAFVATYEPVGEHMLGVFLGSPSASPVKIATTADLDPLVRGVDNIYLIGADDSGNVAFLCESVDNPFGYSVVIGSPSGTLSVIKSLDAAPGTNGQFALPSSAASYAFNAGGDLAFFSSVWNDPSHFGGIWVRNAAGTIQKLAVNGDATGTALGGTYNSFSFRGFNDNGQVLYTAGLSGATTGNGLFLKTAAGAADVLCYRNQLIAGGPQAVDTVDVATLNPSGKAAVIANLKDPAGRGLLLCSPSSGPQVIVLEGSATPAGGTYALISAVRINGSDQMVFRSDILPLNTNGLFFSTSGSPIQTIVTTADTVMSGANKALYAPDTVASDDEMLFWAYTAEGKDTIFTKSLHPGAEIIRRVVGDGDPAPGGGTIAYINRPAMNDKEELVVFSSVIGGTPYPAAALWLSKPGMGLQKLAMSQDPAPGSAGGWFSGFPGTPRINSQSEVAFYANLNGALGGSSSGLFLVSASGTTYSIARVGDASPAGGTFVSFSTTIYLSDSGQVAFRATSQNGNSQTDGLFVGSATSAPLKLMASGDSWSTGTFSHLGAAFKMNRAGQVVFWSDLSFNSGGIFVVSAGTPPVAIALADDNAPVPGSFLEFRFPEAFLDINSSGQVAFWAVYFTETGYGTGYFVGSATTPPTARVSTGQALPGGGSCPILLPVTGGLSLADSGELAMYIPNVSGAADLPRYVIAGADGTLWSFAAVGAGAGDTGSMFGRLGSVSANSTGSFFISATLVEGPARQAIFRSAPVGSRRTVGDFTADHKSDILWHHATLGDVWVWPMDGPTKTAETYVRTVGDTNWEIRGMGDQTGDGKADILWRNKTTGAIYLWPMNGSTPISETYVGTVDPAYDIVGTGDFNGDGKSDILWRHLTNGEVWVWLMDGATPLSQVWVGTVDPAYVIKGVGDLDCDGRADIVWHHGTVGDVWVWLMDGARPLSQTWVATVPDVGYQVQGVADYDGDGKTDILWHHATRGEVWLWRMDGPTRLAETWVGTVPDTGYRIVGTGDYDGDGKADILWHHATAGEVWVWRMNGATTLSQTWVGTVPDVGYQIVKMK